MIPKAFWSVLRRSALLSLQLPLAYIGYGS